MRNVLPSFWSGSALACFLSPAMAQAPLCDFDPAPGEVVLNTDLAQVPTVNCGTLTVAGGVFQFRSFTIRPGVRVRGEGSRPMILLVAGDVVIDGELRVDGQNGERVDTLNSANFPARGGRGACGGGNGGDGSPSRIARDFVAQAGGLGGVGGRLGCGASNATGSGGGGGVFGTVGDPYYPVRNGTGTAFIQQIGVGGYGGGVGSGNAARTLPGGPPGVSPFRDGRDDNDFLGLGFDVNRRLLITGELTGLLGGQGGGGGGDRSASDCSNDPNQWINDNKGGGGGGGGGCLVIFTLGSIRVGAGGHVSANGGHGGGGEQAGSNNQGGGGGGGSGGMLLLYALNEIEFAVHGETYANGDHDFALAADGGVSLRGAFAGFPVTGKYPPVAATTYDYNAAGGFGGLGVIQLFARPGTNADQTNTVLDDNVHFVRGGQRLTGAEKQRYLAWRGFPDGLGVLVDDRGVPTNIGSREGDLRPTPVLLPILQ